MKGTVVLLLAVLSAAHPQEGPTGSDDMTVVAYVDLERYAGVWHEIARIPNRFQKQCVSGTTADYAVREDGRIRVINRCLKANGDADEAEGVAKVEDTATNAKLKVSFVSFLGWRPFWGDYWVVGLEADYQWVAVATPGLKYGWILARTPELPGETMDEIFTILERNGYDRAAFQLSPP